MQHMFCYAWQAARVNDKLLQGVLICRRCCTANVDAPLFSFAVCKHPMLHELIKCLERLAPPRATIPRFDASAMARWHQLHLWSEQPLRDQLPEIRNGVGDAVSLQLVADAAGRRPRLVFSFAKDDVPRGLGYFVNRSVRSSSDANEIRALLRHVEHGDILQPLCDLFGPMPSTAEHGFVAVH